MNLILCPRCGDPVRVPSLNLPPESSFRCQWCHDTFPVAELAAQLPPMLEVLDASGQVLSLEAASPVSLAVPAALATTGSMAESLDDGRGLLAGGAVIAEAPGLAELGQEEVVEEFAINEDGVIEIDPGVDSLGMSDEEEILLGDTEPFGDEMPLVISDDKDQNFAGEPAEDSLAPMNVNTVPDVSIKPSTKKKKRSSGLMTGLKVILGGLLAVPLAGGILAAVGQPLPIDIWPFGGEVDRFAANIEAQKQSRENAGVDRGPSDNDSKQNTVTEVESQPTSVQPTATSRDSSELTAQQAGQRDAFVLPAGSPESEISSSVESSQVLEPAATEIDASDLETSTSAVAASNDRNTSVPSSTDNEFSFPGSGAKEESSDGAASEPARDLTDTATGFAFPNTGSAPTSSAPLPSEIKSLISSADDQLRTALALPSDDAMRRRRLASAFFAISSLGAKIDQPTDDADLMDLLSTVKNADAVSTFRKWASDFVAPQNRAKRPTNGILLIGNLVTDDGTPIVQLVGGNKVHIEGDVSIASGEIIALGQLVDPAGADHETVKILAADVMASVDN